MFVCPKCGSTYTREVEFCGLDGERLIESATDPLIGRTVDRYRIVESIGTGGMARVYRATHIYLEQDFAIKILHGQIAADKSFAKRFHREAKTLGKIRHRNVVGVSDFGATDGGLLFLVMEFLNGPSLSAVIRNDAPLDPARAGAIARQLALGLQAAHARGFVHRDLKPANVILVREDRQEVPKILDFGLVRLLESDEGRVPTQLTAHGQLFGTPAYMSPEQVSGEEVDSRSDLYSLGVMLYQLVTGSTPFVGDIGELVKAHVTEAPPRPVLEYGGLTPLMMKLLEKDAGDRLQSAVEVVEEIERLGLVDKQGSARPRKRSIPPRPLATPIDDMTRSERAPPYEETGASLEIEASAKAALGFRAYWRWILALGLFGVIGFALWVADGQGMFDELKRQQTESPLPPPPPPAITRSNVDPPPPPAPPARRRTKKKPRRTQRPPPTTNPVTPPPPEPPVVAEPDAGRAPPPPPPSAPEPEDAGVVKSFEELDRNLGWALSSRGLSWEDVADAEPEAAKRWTTWFRQTEPPSAAERGRTFDVLIAAANGIVIDRALLTLKLTRARRTLGRVSQAQRDERHALLMDRAKELGIAAGAEPLRKPAERIAAEITLLESDALAALAAAKKAESAPPPVDTPEPEPETPPIATSTSGE